MEHLDRYKPLVFIQQAQKLRMNKGGGQGRFLGVIPVRETKERFQQMQNLPRHGTKGWAMPEPAKE